MGSPSARSARVRALSGSASSARAVAPAAAWFRVALAVRGRAFPRVAAPWLLVTVFAAAWAALAERGHVGVGALRDLAGLKSAYALVATTLGFLLVFRLNRAAARYWDSRAMWGALIAHSRAFAGSAAVQLAHAPNERDNAVRWVAALLVSTPHFLRRDKAICADSLAGVLGAAELQALRAAAHAPLYAAQRARVACARALHVGESTGAGVAARRAYTMGALEAKIDALVGQVGGMERVRGTPLPLVYVAHLRVFLLVGLLSLPLLFYDEWGYGTVPAVALIAAGLLGIDAAASECESPFDRRPNHLQQESFVAAALDNILQLVSQTEEIKAAGGCVALEEPRCL